MECKNIEKLLIDYIEGELSPEVKQKVEEHLSACVICQKQKQEIERVFSVFDQDQVPEPNWLTILNRIKKQAKARRFIYLPYLIPIAAAAILLFFLLPKNNRELELMITAPPSQLVYYSSENIQEKILAELVDSEVTNRLQTMNSSIIESIDLSQLLDDLSSDEKEKFYESIKKEFAQYL